MSQAKTKPERPGRNREIAGVCLLGFGVFASLALVSMQAGKGSMMGPGGLATATGLYSAAGFGAYLIVASLLVVAVRCFRGRPLHQGSGEILSILGILAGGAVLLHLPFAARSMALRGPGGLLGQWLGEITASFIGSVGAALAATLMFALSLMALTDVSVNQVIGVVGWALAHVGRATLAAGRALGRGVVALFPEKADKHDELLEGEGVDEGVDDGFEARAEDSGKYGSDEAPDDDDAPDAEDTIAQLPRVLPDGRVIERTLVGLPVAPVIQAVREAESKAVFVGEAPLLAKAASPAKPKPKPVEVPDEEKDDDEDDEDDEELHAAAAPVSAYDPEVEQRRYVAAVVAEVAAVEYAAESEIEAAARAAEAAVAAAEPAVAEVPPIIIAATRPAEGPAPSIEPPVVSAVAGARELDDTDPDARPPTHDAAGAIVVVPPVRTKKPAAEKAKDDGPGFIRLSEGAFQLPSAELLEYAPPQAQVPDEQSLLSMADKVVSAMNDYGVKGKVSAINMGPVVTMYEFVPAAGTRTGKLGNLENDLAMALAAKAVRIQAPIPGKTAAGIEVPNEKRETVYLKEILLDDAFRSSNSKLQIALGKDIKGAPVSVNLAKMPHLLVAGTTGSGKSVTVNGMITSILFNATPEEVRFIMVDPKMLELSVYEGIPHLLLPVVTDPKKANLALRWAVDEMERRYELLALAGVRDIISYNAKVEADLERERLMAKANAPGGPLSESPSKKGRKLKVTITDEGGVEREVEVDAESGPQAVAAAPVVTEDLREEESARAAAAQAGAEAAAAEPKPKKLPYIVIVIDEFADLMMVAAKDVETSVARIAQKARAAGLHLILATQRPSVDVITGLIKANFPSRIALQVASRIDSRTILDQNGAEALLGNGDMLFSDRGMKLRRLHGAFLSDEEVHRVVDMLKAQAKPVYDMDILKPREDEDGEGAAPVDDYEDAMYDQGVAIVCETRQATVSYLQRRLGIGYNRAARMIEQMERQGVVGPANGIKPREVLAPAGGYLEHAS